MDDEDYEVNRFYVNGTNLKNSEEHAFEVIKLEADSVKDLLCIRSST